MKFDFVLSQWSAWAPGLEVKDDRLLDRANVGLPNYVPKMLQRRFTPLAKAVFNVAYQCANNVQDIPMVFSSAHGEIEKSLDMLKEIQSGAEISPTVFSLSVHNAIAGLFSMAYGNTQEITVIASGQCGIAPAFFEALGILNEGVNEVLVILYDEPISDFYPVSPFKLTSSSPCVLVLRLALTGDGIPLQLSPSRQSHDDGEHAVQLPTFVRFLLTEQRALSLGNQVYSWTWKKK